MGRNVTRSGFPRPRTAAGKPIPWISPRHNLAIKDSKRQRRVAGGKVCQVCGLLLGSMAVAFAYGPWPAAGDRLPPDLTMHAMDHGLLHEHCARIALVHCPELRRLHREGNLSMARVPSGSIEATGAEVERLPL